MMMRARCSTKMGKKIVLPVRFQFADRMIKKVLVATQNAHKVEEIQAILGTVLEVSGAASLGPGPEPEETGTTFEANARIKAEAWRAWIVETSGGRPQFDAILADDSGLEVDALGGAPGVHSARFAATTGHRGNSKDGDNNARLLNLLGDVPIGSRQARFRCTLVLLPVTSAAEASNHGWVFEGTCEGRIATTASGTGGFGYDPLFIPDGFETSLATLGPTVKNRLSHRAKALTLLAESVRSGMVF